MSGDLSKSLSADAFRPGHSADEKPPDRLVLIGLFLLVLILVLNGTYLRIRPATEAPTADWLVWARLGISLAALVCAVILRPGRRRLGMGAFSVLWYLGAVLLSALGSADPKTVLAYAAVLIGPGLLMISLVYRTDSSADLRRLERVWVVTIAILVVKDGLLSLMMPGTETSDESVFRLGTDITHPNQLAMFASLVFWLSLPAGRTWRWLWRLLRGFMMTVVLLAVSRISMAAFILGGGTYLLLRARDWRFSIAGITGACAFLLLTILLDSSQSFYLNDVLRYLERGQEETELMSLSGRTSIWRHAVTTGLESPVVGKGYGVTRFALGTLPDESTFMPFHCHNDFLEAFVSTGSLGFAPFLLLFLYNTGWLLQRKSKEHNAIAILPIHAGCAIVMLGFSTFFESYLSNKLTPLIVLFFFYALARDRWKFFSNHNN